MELAPDLSTEFNEDDFPENLDPTVEGDTLQDFLVVILYKEKRIVELQAKAYSTQDLREQYIRMLTGMSMQKGVKVQVYKKVDNDWHIVEEHLF